MGLDSYLQARKTVSQIDYIKGEATINEDYASLTALVAPDLDKFGEYKSITVSTQSAYWRKANQIHVWFVDNVQEGEDDCGEHWVKPTQLQELLDLCKQVVNDPLQAEDLLPTGEGFFFGSDAYDEYYFEQIQYTIEVLEHLLDNAYTTDYDFYYHSSW